MKQSEIYYADLNPLSRSKKKVPVPVVIISGNAMNDNLGMCIVCPLIEKVRHYAGCVVLYKDKLNNLKHDSEIIPFQITTIAKKQLIKKIGQITDAQYNEVMDGLSDVLKW